MQKTIRHIQEALDGLYPPEEIRALTRLLQEEVCGLSPVEAFLHKDRILDEPIRKKIEVIVERLKKNEPVQYVLGHTHFDGLRIGVAPGVLIPRPETEELTLLIADENRECPPSSIVDIGTGSGCIAIALSHRFPECRVEGWDISPDALRIAEANNRSLGTRVQFRQLDILHFTPEADAYGHYDMIVSNPPYIVPSEADAMEPNVLDHEPHSALFVPEEEPLLFYRAIAVAARHLLHDGGRLYFEINPLFARETEQMLHDEGFRHIQVRRDLSGRERFASATR